MEVEESKHKTIERICEEELKSSETLPTASYGSSSDSAIQAVVQKKLLSRFLWYGMALAGILLFAYRYTMNPDGLSYLEVGESWLRGDFANAINGYWNPLYPILAALSAKTLPSATLDPVGPRILNFLLFIAAYFAFRAFLKDLLARYLPNKDERFVQTLHLVLLPTFLWCAISVNQIVELIPDLLVMICLLLALARLFRWEARGVKEAICFGALLGSAFLAKTVMFPLGAVFLAASSFTVKPLGRGIFLALVASAAFAVVSATYIIPLSLQKKRFTYGESGRLAYAWEVNRFGPYFHWQGSPPGSGTPVRPTRRILDYPPTYEFSSDALGTYPLWRDPSYWNEGIRPRFEVRDQFRRLGKSAKFYRETLVREPILIAFFFVLSLGITMIGWRSYLDGVRPLLPILFAALVPFALYSAVYIDFRYLAPFILLLVTLLLTGYLRARETITKHEITCARVLSVFVSAMLACNVLFLAFASLVRQQNWNSYLTHQRIARSLESSGVRRGAPLAVIGRGCEAYFARILGSQIVAETIVLPGHPEWEPTAENFEKISSSVKDSSSAVAIVCMYPTTNPMPAGWIAIPGTLGYFQILRANDHLPSVTQIR